MENICPIYLISCMGKLFEHMVHDRITHYLEINGHLTDTMLAYMQQLSMQEVPLLPKELFDHLDNRSKYSILAVDIPEVLDNNSHDAILNNIESTGCGTKTFTHIRNFLRARTAAVGICNISSESFELPNRGTLQGSVI
ncbi:uncharacterized protein [Dermacentor albipictus]|uniref:uncharacterized protein n=1 Tax=Dermacentor albipictus TaxID=60249 RepID=UPI0038FCA5D6